MNNTLPTVVCEYEQCITNSCMVNEQCFTNSCVVNEQCITNRIIVDKIDQDGDGQVTEQELRDWIQYVQKRYIVSDTDRSWADHDSDSDNTLTWDSYKKRAFGSSDGKNCSSIPPICWFSHDTFHTTHVCQAHTLCCFSRCCCSATIYEKL